LLRLHDGSERGAADADEHGGDDQGAHGHGRPSPAAMRNITSLLAGSAMGLEPVDHVRRQPDVTLAALVECVLEAH
jgi:hypothetical protein